MSFYAVACGEEYYAGNGTYVSDAFYASRFSNLNDAEMAASSLNSQGYCNGQNRTVIVTIGQSIVTDDALKTNLILTSTSISEKLQKTDVLSEVRQGYGISASVFGGVPGAIDGATSIDSNLIQDNGFLACARSKNPAGGLHGTTSQAISNLLSSLGSTANLVGHGTDGVIGTGMGDGSGGNWPSDQHIALSNRSSWETELSKLRGRYSSLKLWACHPGAGETGADFLFMLAQIINVPVAGPTGFIYCGPDNVDLFLEANSVWQVATPTQRPIPIKAPTPYFVEFFMDIKLLEDGQTRTIPLSDVTSVQYISNKSSETDEILTLTDDNARDLLQLVRFDAPFRPGGVPAAMVTGRLIFAFQLDGQQQEREFRIYNNRLLQNVTSPETFYHVTEGFTQSLITLR